MTGLNITPATIFIALLLAFLFACAVSGVLIFQNPGI